MAVGWERLDARLRADGEADLAEAIVETQAHFGPREAPWLRAPCDPSEGRPTIITSIFCSAAREDVFDLFGSATMRETVWEGESPADATRRLLRKAFKGTPGLMAKVSMKLALRGLDLEAAMTRD